MYTYIYVTKLCIVFNNITMFHNNPTFVTMAEKMEMWKKYTHIIIIHYYCNDIQPSTVISDQ